MFKMKLEGSDYSDVQENEAFIENEQKDIVNEEPTETIEEKVEVEENKVENVLTFNNDDDILEYLKTKEELVSKVAPKQEGKVKQCLNKLKRKEKYRS